MEIVVIGNGATAVDEMGCLLVNRHTAGFLVGLRARVTGVAFVQPKHAYKRVGGLQDQALPGDKIRGLLIDRRRLTALVMSFFPVLWQVLWADFVYIFFPGSLPRVIGGLCGVVGKPYGLYLRGGQFVSSGTDARIFSRSRFIITVSEAFAQRLTALNPRITPIRPMLEISASDALRRDHLSRGKSVVNLLFVGRIEAPKGLSELVEAAEMLLARGLQIRLSLIGGGPLYDDLFARYGNDSGAPIRVCGPISDKEKLMRAYETADFFVLPSHHEGFPRVLYEAMIKSTVVVTTMVGGIPGLMHDGENCVAIPVGQPGAIADAIERASQDPARMQALADAGLKTVLEVMSRYPSHLEALMGALHGRA